MTVRLLRIRCPGGALPTRAPRGFADAGSRLAARLPTSRASDGNAGPTVTERSSNLPAA